MKMLSIPPVEAEDLLATPLSPSLPVFDKEELLRLARALPAPLRDAITAVWKAEQQGGDLPAAAESLRAVGRALGEDPAWIEGFIRRSTARAALRPAAPAPRNPTSLRADRRSLARAFPACFNRPKSKAPKRPLKIGIAADAVARGVIGEDGQPLTTKRIERAVTDYCTGTKYAAALVAGAVRIDLDGTPAGMVLPAHAEE